MEKELVEKRKFKKKSAITVIAALALVVISAGYIVYRIFSENAYNEKWKDYDECGLA
jgi:flagellar basal body-associated protein FliL